MSKRSGVALGIAIAAISLAAHPNVARAETPAPPGSGAPVAPAPTLVLVADNDAARSAIAGFGAALPSPWRLADDVAFRRALTAAGQRTAPGVALGTASGRRALTPLARRAAADAGVTAVLFVQASRSRTGSSVTLLLVTPSSADPALDASVEIASSQGSQATAPLASVLSPALARITPRPTPASVTDAPPPANAVAVGPPPPKEAPRLGRADRAIGVFSAGGGTGSRFFSYHDGLSPKLRSYSLAASPNLVLAGELYPMARLSVPVLRGLGVAGGVTHAVGVSSKTSSGESVSTTWTRAEGDLRLRFGFAGDEQDGARVVLVVRGGVLMERFGFSGDATLLPWLPDVSYLFWRAGADGRFRVGPVALLAGFSYLPAIAGGEVPARFRETSFAGIETHAGIAVPLARIFELRAEANYTRVFYSFNPTPGDLYVAGGALDQLVRANLLATLLL